MSALVWLGFGLIIGSFTNVLILREGSNALRGRSACPSCARGLSAWELIPVLSWVLLRARCRTCRAPISIQYPIVEVLVGVGFWWVGMLAVPLVLQIVAAAIVVLCVAIAVYDFYHMLMPNAWVWAWNVCALVFTGLWLWLVGAPIQQYVEAFGWGIAVAAPLFALHTFSHGAWMGFGDVKFALGIGFLLGPYGFLALFYAFISGAVVGLLLVFISSPHAARLKSFVTPTTEAAAEPVKVTMKSEVPFGPFLILGTMLLWLALFYVYKPILTAFGALPL